jgi:hypothetical protein
VEDRIYGTLVSIQKQLDKSQRDQPIKKYRSLLFDLQHVKLLATALTIVATKRRQDKNPFRKRRSAGLFHSRDLEIVKNIFILIPEG